MKACNRILFAAFVIIMLCHTVYGQWVPPRSRFDVSPESQRQNAIYQQQQAEIAAQKTAAQEAAKQAEIDNAITSLESERDSIINKMSLTNDFQITETKSQIAKLKQEYLNISEQRNSAEKENAHLRAKQLFQPKDPWRRLDGKTYNAKDELWLHFRGRVLEVKPNGILVDGEFGPPMEVSFGKRVFFVEDFPIQNYPMADDETITAPMSFVAYLGGKSSIYQYTNTTIDLRVNTVRKLQYGKVVNSPPPDLVKKWQVNLIPIADVNPKITEELDANQAKQAVLEARISLIQNSFFESKEMITSEYAVKIKDVPDNLARLAKEKKEAKLQAIKNKALKSNQDAADRGDDYGLLRMGERYRDGDGVEKNLTKAREYLTKAAAAGSSTATDELKQFPSN